LTGCVVVHGTIRTVPDGRDHGTHDDQAVEDTPTLEHPLPDDLVGLIAERFHALSEPTRIKLLDRLRDGDATVYELTELVGSSQQNISKHLGVLRRAGIVRRRKLGNHVQYSIADAGVFGLCETVCGSLRRQLEELGAVVGVAR